MTKVAIIWDGKNERYEAHRYNLWFKILPFGNMVTYITLSSSKERLIEDVKRKLYGNVKLIEILEL